MEIKEIAKQYAIAALDNQIYLVAQAFTDGYDKACKELLNLPIEEDGVKYIDLGLPSGTLWSERLLLTNENVVVVLPHGKAQELPLPTKEQVEELISVCQIHNHSNSFQGCTTLIGPNGNEISYGNSNLWLASEASEDNTALSFSVLNQIIRSSFTGEKKRVALVKKP